MPDKDSIFSLREAGLRLVFIMLGQFLYRLEFVRRLYNKKFKCSLYCISGSLPPFGSHFVTYMLDSQRSAVRIYLAISLNVIEFVFLLRFADPHRLLVT